MTVTNGRDDAPPDVQAVREDGGAGGRRLSLLVVGVDGTVAGATALRWAVDQARGSGARVLAVAVSEPLPLGAGGPEIAGGAMVPATLDDEQFVAAADAWLTEAITALPAEGRRFVDRHVGRGDAVAVLLEAARDADLLVLGNHGRGALGGLLAGSVAQRCVRHATCPLVLVPAPEESGSEETASEGTGQGRGATDETAR